MKKRNAGFTLVELVIAVVILAIAVVPLFANFIQSGKMNLNSRKRLNAMNLAQDIMEGMSQYTVSENSAFLDAATVSSNTLEIKRILPSGTTIASCEKDATLSNEHMFVYNITGVQTAAGTYNNYDMTVTIDATKINFDHLKKIKPTIAEAETDAKAAAKYYNGSEMASITQIDQYFDAIYKIEESEENNAIVELRDLSTKPTTPTSSYSGKVKRDIKISIVNNGTAAAPDYSAEIISEYSVLDTAKTALGFTGTHANATTVKRSGNISKASSDIMPRSIYLYYEGLKDTKKTAPLETIHISNTTGQPIKIYLIRVINPTTTTALYNNQYRADVYIEDVAEKTNLISNLRFDLFYDQNFRLYQEGSNVEYAPGRSVADAALPNHYDKDRSNIYYNSTTAKISEDMYVKHISDGFKQEEKDVLYDVTLEIKETGKSNVIATYTGGLSN